MQKYKKILLVIPFLNISLWFIWISIYNKYKIFESKYPIRRILVWFSTFIPWGLLALFIELFDLWDFRIGDFYFIAIVFLFIGSYAVAGICFIDELLLIKKQTKYTESNDSIKEEKVSDTPQDSHPIDE